MAQRLNRMTWLGAAVVASFGCAEDPGPVPRVDDAGTIEVALTSVVGAATYVLEATFGIARVQPPPTGDDAIALRLNTADTIGPTLTTPNLSVGRYAVVMLDGWELKRLDTPATLVPVQATLLSANPVTVSVFSAQATPVTFQFETNGMPITFAPGTIRIGVQVRACDPQAPPGAELNVIANPGFENGATGWGGVNSISDTAHCGLHSGAAEGNPKFGEAELWFGWSGTGALTTYAVTGWLRTSASSASVQVRVADGSCGMAADGPPATATSTEWTRFASTVSIGGPDCSGANAVYLYVSGLRGPMLFVDDVYAVPQ